MWRQFHGDLEIKFHSISKIPYYGIKITEIIMLVYRLKNLKKKVCNFYILKNEITNFF